MKKNATWKLALMAVALLVGLQTASWAQEDEKTQPKVRIRSVNSIGSINPDGPLYILDGVILDTDKNPLDDAVDPHDIKAIHVLKGEAATAIYGSRASEGVIIIETKAFDKKKKEKIVQAEKVEQIEDAAEKPAASIEPKLEVVAYPNPFVDGFKLRLPPSEGVYSVTLFDEFGKVVLAETYKAGLHAVSLKESVPGVYTLRVVSGGQVDYIHLVRK